MIEKGGTKGHVVFTLTCDYCGEACEEQFETFDDAVDYKTDRENRWCSIKDKNGDWMELCPTCNKPETIAELKGYGRPGAPRDELSASQLALTALEEP